MICYPADANETEISAIDDYWLLSKNSPAGFLYKRKEIKDLYKFRNVTRFDLLVRDSCFLPYDELSKFICHDCNQKKPVNNRSDYSERIKSDMPFVCYKCADKRIVDRVNEARQVIQKYRSENIQPKNYINSLEFEELLALYTILRKHLDNDFFINQSIDAISLTGISLIDIHLLTSLTNKKALLDLTKIPSEVENANTELFGNYNELTYKDIYKTSADYLKTGPVRSGIFLNTPDTDQHLNIPIIKNILYQKLRAHVASVDDTSKIHQIIKEVQISKLYKLVSYTSKEYQLSIDNSPKLHSFLDYLAENYEPEMLFFTFGMKAKDAVLYIHKNRHPPYRAKYYFTKFMERFIQNVEEKSIKLEKTRQLPPSVTKSNFESTFSEVYLNGQPDWNKLSTKRIVALWLENVRLSDDVIGLASDAEKGDSTH